MNRFIKVWNFFWDWFFWPAWTVWVVVGCLTGIMGTTFGLVILGISVVFWFGMTKLQENISNGYKNTVKVYEKMISAGKF